MEKVAVFVAAGWTAGCAARVQACPPQRTAASQRALVRFISFLPGTGGGPSEKLTREPVPSDSRAVARQWQYGRVRSQTDLAGKGQGMAISEVPAQEYPDIVGPVPVEPHAIPFRPFIPASVTLPELTIVPLFVGTLLGIIFGASSLYLVLKVGLTVSASIPGAVISLPIFRALRGIGFRGASILENNIVQTAGSAGESIAFGVGVTMPAIMILGFDLEVTRVMLVAVLGGLLGILMMIPLRRALIVQQHGLLKYPEGTACAEVLKA